MVERKLYKTKLCLLYQRGRCSRQYCNFAHGDAELRRSFNGGHERGRDLRQRLERMRSPLRKYSPGRDTRGRHSSHGDSPHSFGKRNDRNQRKRQKVDGHSDYSGSIRISDGTEDQLKDRKHIDEQVQLREMNSEIKILDKEKKRLKAYLEDKDQESKNLSSKIQDLQKQLLIEKAERKRITTRMKKFIKAHNRFLRLKSELARAQSQLEKLGEQLDLDASGPGNEDDLKLHSDDEHGGKNASSQFHDYRINSTLQKRRSGVSPEAHDGSTEGNRVTGETTDIRSNGIGRLSRQFEEYDISNNDSKKLEPDGDANNIHNPVSYEDMSLRTNKPPDIALSYKHKSSEIGRTLPPTGIAALAIEEDVEVVEMDERSQGMVVPSTAIETEVALKTSHLPFLPLPPPPPIPQNVYLQYRGDDEKVDIDGVDDEMVDIV